MAKENRRPASSDTYHVTSRGNRQAVIFVDEIDYRRWQCIVDSVVAKHRWTVLAYALLPNHYHLLIRSPVDDLSRGMNLLNGRFGQAFNRRYGFTGHLFQGRFDSETVETDGHLFQSLRYIALNPVRADLCDCPEGWPWASYPIVARRASGGSTADDEVLALFGLTREEARRRFRDFVADAR